MDEIVKFVSRMYKCNVNVIVSLNYPWVYLESINGKEVTEKRWSKHNYTLCLFKVKKCKRGLEWLDLKETFNLIKKYK